MTYSIHRFIKNVLILYILSTLCACAGIFKKDERPITELLPIQKLQVIEVSDNSVISVTAKEIDVLIDYQNKCIESLLSKGDYEQVKKTGFLELKSFESVIGRAKFISLISKKDYSKMR